MYKTCIFILGKLNKAVEVALNAEGDTGIDALSRVANSIISSGPGNCSPTLARRLIAPLISTNQTQQAAIILATAKLVNF